MTEEEPSTRPRRRRRTTTGPLAWFREAGIIVVSALVLSWLIKTFLVQSFSIPSESMEDTLMIGDRVLVSKLRPGPLDLRRGDIVVFVDPGNWLGSTPEKSGGSLAAVGRDIATWVGLLPQDAGHHVIKRIIGLPGDRVACAGPGEPVTVNGVAIDEPYLAPGAMPSEIAFDVVVPEDHIWVMGDNRQHSGDSRRHMGDPGGGAVPTDDVVGTAFSIIYPMDRWSSLNNPGTFSDVPDPTS